MKKGISWEKMTFLLLLAGVLFLYPGQRLGLLKGESSSPSLRALPLAVPSPASYPVNTTGIYPQAEVTANGVVILDADADVFLYERGSELPLSPASTTKILTALVALETYELDEVVTVGQIVQEGATMGLVPGERITVENLLYGALIQSGNDAAWTLAEHYPGGVSEFVRAMNEKALELHLVKSHFTNPVGYDDIAHKMTPRDLARLSQIALKNATIAKMVAIPQITVSDVTHTFFHPLTNVNQLLGKIPGVGGIKTGWTEEAGENLVTLVERGGHRIIVVVLHSQDRFGDTSRLIDWVFANHQWEIFREQ